MSNETTSGSQHELPSVQMAEKLLTIRIERERLQAELSERCEAISKGQKILMETQEPEEGITDGSIQRLMDEPPEENGEAVENDEIDREIILAMARRDVPRMREKLDDLDNQEQRLLEGLSRKARKEIERIVTSRLKTLK